MSNLRAEHLHVIVWNEPPSTGYFCLSHWFRPRSRVEGRGIRRWAHATPPRERVTLRSFASSGIIPVPDLAMSVPNNPGSVGRSRTAESAPILITASCIPRASSTEAAPPSCTASQASNYPHWIFLPGVPIGWPLPPPATPTTNVNPSPSIKSFAPPKLSMYFC